MGHRYVAFRIRLTGHALRELAASLKSSAEIILLLAGPGLLGLLACIALPPLYAATLAWPSALAWLLAHAVAMSLPAWLLRKRLLPLDVTRWLHALPIARAVQLKADAAVAAIVLAPLGGAYAISLTIWLVQSPPWLRALPGGLATLASLGISWLCVIAMLGWRARARMPRLRRPRPGPASYRVRSMRPRALLFWHRLFWLPFWRCDSRVGWQQSVLLLPAAGSALAWMAPGTTLPRAALGACTSLMLIVLTERGDHAVREQIALLAPVMAGWPRSLRQLSWWARAFALLPALGVLILLGRHGHWQRGAGLLYLVLAALGALLLVGMPRYTARARVGCVILSIVILTAVGSEIWN